MKKITEFIAELARNEIRLRLEEGKLKLSAPKTGVNPQLIAEIRTRKTELIAFIQSTSVGGSNKINRVKVQDTYPASDAQRRLWILSKFEGGSAAYNMWSSFIITQELAIDTFKKAIDLTIERHEILRTVFRENSNREPEQVVLSIEEQKFELELCLWDNNVDALSKVQAYIEEDKEKEFDLENGPLLSGALFKIKKDYFIFHFNMHHIIGDGWSNQIISRDILEYYSALMQGREPLLPSLDIQYKDYANWQLNNVNSAEGENHLKYWLKQLAGDLPVLSLPNSKPRSAVKSYKGDAIQGYLDTKLTQKVDAFVTKKGGSTFITMLSSWAILLARMTGENDLIIGSPVAGRDNIDLKDQIGFYINMIAHRFNVDEALSFNTFYEQVKKQILTSFEHQSYPFDKLVDKLDIKGNPSRNPIFDIILSYDEFAYNKELQGFQLKPLEAEGAEGNTAAKFDLDINFKREDNRLGYTLIYSSSLFEKEEIERLLAHYWLLLDNLLSNQDKVITDLYTLPQDEKTKLLQFSKGIKKETTFTSVLDIFHENVISRPKNSAVDFNGKALTYEKLDQLSNQLAHYLISVHGVGEEDLVGIKLDNSEWLIISILAIMKAGGAYVPIDPNYPKERIDYIQEDCNYKCCIDHEFLNAFELKGDNQPKSNPNRIISPENLAYVIYTSGSTGKPKGVLIEHKGLVNKVLDELAFLNLDEKVISCLNTNFTFDVSLLEIFLPLLGGGKLIIPSKIVSKNSFELNELIVDQGVNVLQGTPSFFNRLLDAGNTSQFTGLSKYLKQICIGGESLTASLVKKIQAVLPNVIINNHYGPTETTIDAIAYENVKDFESNVIGRPMSNTNVFILDKNERIQPIGSIGELCVGGIGVARGYLNLPNLTQEKFIANPFVNGDTLYKTGDLAKWLPNGNIEFIGREDDQVKIKGHRIELGEIEHALNKIPGINSNVVIVSEEAESEKELVAYICSTEDYDIATLRAGLQKELPDYMLPSVFVRIEQMPITSNGKVDKKALPNLGGSILATGESYVSPRTENEKHLVRVWENVLKRNLISIRDNFYNLGGDSIKSIQVVSRLKQVGLKLKIEDLMTKPILEDQARLITSDDRLIEQKEVEGKVELTPIQQHFFEAPLYKNRSHYNQAVLLKAKERLNPVILEQSLAVLTAHHDALRIRFKRADSGIIQDNAPVSENDFNYVFHDLKSKQFPEKLFTRELETLHTSFDLEEGPLFTLAHFEFANEDRLVFIIHHLIVDGVSWRILLEDFTSLFEQISKNQKPNLPLKTDSFQKWASIQAEYANKLDKTEERIYWENLLNEDGAMLPFDKGNQEIKHDDTCSFSLSKRYTSLLQTAVNKTYHTEINDLLLTALGLSVKDTFGIEKCMLKLEGHGRESINKEVDISRTIGWFTSVYPFLLDVSSVENQEEALVKVKESLRKIPQKGIGYGILKYLTEDRFTKELSPSIEFNYLGDFGNNQTDKTSIFVHSDEATGNASSPLNFDGDLINVSGIILEEELSINIRFDTTNFDRLQIEKFTASYKEHLKLLIDALAVRNRRIYTPSDLTFKGLSVLELNELNRVGAVEDVYRLSPLQKGIYFHWLKDQSSSAYFEQVSYRLKGNLNAESIEKAYKALIKRHAVLRTSFRNDLAGEVLQIVRKEVPIAVEQLRLDLALSDKEREEEIEKVKKQDRRKGFDLSEASQMRLHLITIAENEFEFIWSFHHILMDGWCMGIITKEFYQLLQSFDKEETLSLPEVKKYATFIKWLEEKDTQASSTYWKDYLNGYSSTIGLPFIKEAAATSGQEPSLEVFKIEGALYEKMELFCKKNGVTQNTFIQGVWGYLLARYNNVDDVVFGLVVSGRPAELSAVEDMVGLFINTIPVRVKVNKKDAVTDLICRLQEEAISSSSHHYMSLSEVQNLSEIGNKLIDHILVFENYPIEDFIESDIAGDSVPFEIKSAQSFDQTNYGLTISVSPEVNALRMKFQFFADATDKTGVDSLIQSFKAVINGFLDNQEGEVNSVKLLNKTAQKEVLSNSGITLTYKVSSIVDVFDAQVVLSPASRAVSFYNETLTYAELNNYANQFAHYLCENKGVQKGDLVGVKLDRNQWIVIAILGVLKTGAAYVPIDPTYPQNRISYIEEDTSCSVCIDQELLDEFIKTHTDYSSKQPDVSILPNDLAYVIYTSGSTGRPKGVMVEHGSVVNIYNGWLHSYKLSNKEVLLQLASFSFDVSVGDICRSLLVGGEMVICDNKTKLDPESLYHLIEAHSITIFEGTPAIVIPLMRFISENELPLHALKTLILGADSIQVHDFNWLIGAYGSSLHIINSYGVTEATIDSTYFSYDAKNWNLESLKVPIGKPFPNTKTYILNDQQHLQPVGVIGELCIGGKGIARGYLNRPDLTAEKFTLNPFVEGECFYKTGDLARWLPNGNIEFIGRKDEQVKIKGYRIELGEIEHVLNSVSGILSSVVTVNETIETGKELIAYITSSKALQLKDIRSALQKQLPEYMVPLQFVQVEKFHLTVNGKVDKKRLPLPEGNSIMTGESYFPPSTENEKQLVKVWEAVLNRKQISIRDNFYNLGGDSIKSIQIVSRLKQVNLKLKIEDLMSFPVLEEQAHLIVADNSVIDQSMINGQVELTPIQKHFFYGDIYKDPTHYNQSVLLKSKGPLDKSVLKKVLSELTRHHDALRMRFESHENRIVQYNEIAGDEDYLFASFDLKSVQFSEEVFTQELELLQAKFDLENTPLFTVAHFQFATEERLVFIVHHLVVDGVSWRILLEDFTNLYEQGSKRKKLSLPLKTDSFQKWAVLQCEIAKQLDTTDERKYWEKQLKQQIPQLPVDNKTQEIKHNQTCTFRIGKENTNLLQTKVHDAYHTEINDLLLTALATALKKSFGVEKSVIKLEGHGREEATNNVDVSRTVGWFTSVYPFILDVSTVADQKTALVQIKENLRKVPNKGVGYGMLKYLTEKSFNFDFPPSIEFNYLGDFGDEKSVAATAFSHGDEYVGLESSPKNLNEDLLSISGMIMGGELSFTIRYSSDNYQRNTIEQLCDAYCLELNELIEELSSRTIQTLTPSDLTFKALSIAEVNRINIDGELEDIYRLSPLQEGIYYHWLKDPNSSAYFEQVSYRLKGKLNVDAIEQAYNELIERHAVLRTSFSNNYAGELLQIVRKKVPSTFVYRQSDPALNDLEKEDYLDTIRKQDRAKGMDLSSPSQIRLHLIKLSEVEYEFIWSHHHILMDGWCMGIINREFYRILESIESKTPVKLAPVNNYVNYIKWLSKRNVQVSREYWEEYLVDYNSVATLPFANKKIVSPSIPAEETLHISDSLLSKIKTYCNKNGITQNTFIQGVWGYLLSRYNNTNDVVIGSVVSGRTSEIAGVEDMVGLFINTVPVRIKYSPQEDVTGFLKRLQQEAIASNAHHYMSLSEVQDLSELRRELIDHVLVFQNFPIEETITADIESGAGLFEVTNVETFFETNYDFSIAVYNASQTLNIEFQYASGKIEKENIKRIVGHFETLLNQVVSQGELTINNWNYLSVDEVTQVQNTFNQTAFEFDSNNTLLSGFNQAAQSSPDHKALIFKGEEISYRELDEQSTQLGNYILSKYKIQPGDFVGIKLGRSKWSIISIIAILKCNCTYVPIDPSYPPERIEYIENDIECAISIDDELINAFALDHKNWNKMRIVNQQMPDDLAYVIYTSGSTGKPKGVKVKHSNVVNLINYQTKYFSVSNNERILLFSSISFDASVEQIFLALYNGLTLCMASQEEILAPASLEQFIINNEVTHVHAVPSVLKNLNFALCKHLKRIVSGGDIFNAQIKASVPDVEIYNEYGPTETTITSIERRVQSAEDFERNIGKPVGNTQVYILSNSQQLQGVGIVGEIFIGGAGVAIGYHNQPQLSHEKFVKSPFSNNEILYKSGDLAKWLPNGEIEFVGRNDRQVKVRGYRIEIGEIEHALNAIPDINRAHVTVSDQVNGENEITCYLVSDNELTVKKMRDKLLDVLPDYMVPSHFVQLDEFPLTPNGKIDLATLSSQANAAISTGEKYVGAETDEEKELVKVLGMLLSVDHDLIGVNDNFFDLGLNSIKMIRFAGLIKSQIGYDVQLVTLFENPNVSALAAHIQNSSKPQNEMDTADSEDLNLADEIDEMIDLI